MYEAIYLGIPRLQHRQRSHRNVKDSIKARLAVRSDSIAIGKIAGKFFCSPAAKCARQANPPAAIESIPSCPIQCRSGAAPRLLPSCNTASCYCLVPQVDSLIGPERRPRNYRRQQNASWDENNCVESNAYIAVNKQGLWSAGNGLSMPSKKDQPQDLRCFKNIGKIETVFRFD